MVFNNNNYINNKNNNITDNNNVALIKIISQKREAKTELYMIFFYDDLR